MGKCSEAFLSSLAPGEAAVLERLQSDYEKKKPKWKNTIVIHHKLPGTPFSSFCSRNSLERPLLVIGRMMTEASYLSPSEVEQAANMDEIWVPSDYHISVFTDAGIPDSKLFVLPEAANVDFYANKEIFDSNIKDECVQAKTDAENCQTLPVTKQKQKIFQFVSVFKYEGRKGADILLTSYWRAFTNDDAVELVIRSYKPSWERGTSNLMNAFNQLALGTFGVPMSQLAKVTWIEENLSKKELRTLYQTSDVFVLPTRGEGWCLPCVEAMSAGLPIIVTNFSGPTMYLRSEHSYPLPILKNKDSGAALLNDDGTAKPDSDQLSALMRYVYLNQDEAKEKGLKAQEFAAQEFNPLHLATRIHDRLHYLYNQKRKLKI